MTGIIDAYNTIVEQNLLPPAAMTCYKALFRLVVATAAEIGREAGPTAPKGYWKRVSDLKRYGVITEVGRRRCRVTGKLAKTYTCSGKLPASKNNNAHIRKRIVELQSEILRAVYNLGADIGRSKVKFSSEEPDVGEQEDIILEKQAKVALSRLFKYSFVYYGLVQESRK